MLKHALRPRLVAFTSPLTALLLPGLLTVSGCEKDPNSGETADGSGEEDSADTDLQSNACGDEQQFNIGLQDAQNYKFQSTLSLESTAINPKSDFRVDWSGVETDLTQHKIDASKEIGLVQLMLWRLTEAELEVKLNDDALAQKDMEAIVTIEPKDGQTSANLFDFTSFGNELTPDELLAYFDPETFDPAKFAYTVMIASGTELGQGTRMLAMLRLDESADNTEVKLHSGSAGLEYEVDLRSLEPLRVATGTAHITLDWDNIEKNAMGHDWEKTSIQRVKVARYSKTPEEIEKEFLFLEDIAEDLWSGDIDSGTAVDLSLLVNEDNETFSGITDEGTWIVALECSSCANPAPWFISILAPC